MKYYVSNILQKKIFKLKGQPLINLLNKIKSVASSDNVDNYKNLKYNLKEFKRTHVSNSKVLLFYEKEGILYFVEYLHHDDAYNYGNNYLKKYEDLNFADLVLKEDLEIYSVNEKEWIKSIIYDEDLIDIEDFFYLSEETLRDIERSKEEFEKGNFITWEDAKKILGI